MRQAHIATKAEEERLKEAVTSKKVSRWNKKQHEDSIWFNSNDMFCESNWLHSAKKSESNKSELTMVDSVHLIKQPLELERNRAEV